MTGQAARQRNTDREPAREILEGEKQGQGAGHKHRQKTGSTGKGKQKPGEKKKKKSQQHGREKDPGDSSGHRRGATGPRGPGTHRSSRSQHCRETLPLQMLLSPALLPSSSVTLVAWLSST